MGRPAAGAMNHDDKTKSVPPIGSKALTTCALCHYQSRPESLTTLPGYAWGYTRPARCSCWNLTLFGRARAWRSLCAFRYPTCLAPHPKSRRLPPPESCPHFVRSACRFRTPFVTCRIVRLAYRPGAISSRAVHSASTVSVKPPFRNDVKVHSSRRPAAGSPPSPCGSCP
jgi:hypothetical protein